MSAEKLPGTSSKNTTNAALSVGNDQDVTPATAVWNVTTIMTALSKGTIVGVLRNAVQKLELDAAGKNTGIPTKRTHHFAFSLGSKPNRFRLHQ